MHQYYPLADLVVVPSEFEEPFGMVAIEAMSCGTPVLATRRGGLPEIITNDVTGFLLDDAKDYAAFASRLNELLDGPARLEGVSRTARTYVEQRHDWNMVTQQLESLYDRLLRDIPKHACMSRPARQPKPIRSVRIHAGQGDVLMAINGLQALLDLGAPFLAEDACVYTRTNTESLIRAILPNIRVTSLQESKHVPHPGMSSSNAPRGPRSCGTGSTPTTTSTFPNVA